MIEHFMLRCCWSKIQKLWGFFSWRNKPYVPGPPHYLRFTITLRHTTLGSIPLDKRSARHRDLYLKTQHWQERVISESSGIRTRNPSKQAAADSHLRPRSHWVRQPSALYSVQMIIQLLFSELSHCEQLQWPAGRIRKRHHRYFHNDCKYRLSRLRSDPHWYV